MVTPVGQPQTEPSLLAEPELDSIYFSSNSSVELSPRPHHKTMPVLSEKREATVSHPNTARPPRLSDGKVTPGVVRQFEYLCETFFMYAKGGIGEEQKVARLFGSFQSQRIKDWIIANDTTLTALTFPAGDGSRSTGRSPYRPRFSVPLWIQPRKRSRHG